MQTGGSLPTHPPKLGPLGKKSRGRDLFTTLGLGTFNMSGVVVWISPGCVGGANVLKLPDTITLQDAPYILLGFKIHCISYFTEPLLFLDPLSFFSPCHFAFHLQGGV